MSPGSESDNFLEGLKSLNHHPIVGEIRGSGLWTAVDFTADKKTRSLLPPERLNNICCHARQLGLILKVSSQGQAIEFAPPLVISKEEIDEPLKIIDQDISAAEKDVD